MRLWHVDLLPKLHVSNYSDSIENVALYVAPGGARSTQQLIMCLRTPMHVYSGITCMSLMRCASGNITSKASGQIVTIGEKQSVLSIRHLLVLKYCHTAIQNTMPITLRNVSPT